MNRLKLTLRQKIILPLVVCGILMAGYIYVVPYNEFIEHGKDDIENNFSLNLKYLSIPITTALLENDLSYIYEIIDSTLAENPDWYSLQLFNSDGVLIYPLESSPEILANINEYKSYERKLNYQTNHLGNLILHVDIQHYLNEHLFFINNLIYSNFIVFVIILIMISFIVDYLIRKPVSNLAKIAGQMAKGNFDIELSNKSQDEVGDLVDAFERMRDSLIKSKLELENQKYALDMHCMVCVADDDELIIYANERFCVTGAYDKVDVISKGMFSLIDELSTPNIKNKILSVVNSGESWNGQLTNIKKNGSHYYTEATIVPFLNDKGKPYRYIFIQTDITMQVYSERMVSEASERINHLLKYSATIIYSRSLSQNLGVNFISENLFNILGYEQSDVLNDPLFFERHIHSDDVFKYKHNLQSVYENELDSIEYRFKHAKGHYIWIIDKHRVVYNESGKPVDIVGSLGDITERIEVKNEIELQVKQQAAVSSLGQIALKNNEVDVLFSKTVKVLSKMLNIDLCLILKLDLAEDVFTVQTIEGFEGELSADLKIPADNSTHAGQTLSINAEVLIEDLASDTRFAKPNFLTQLGLSSGLTIPISGRNNLYGVLCVYTIEHHLFTYDDVQFIRSVANVLGLSVERQTFQAELINYQEHLVEMVDEQTQDLIVTRDAALIAERSMSTFLSNMSHELRTPLHGILSFARFGLKKYETASKEKLYDYFTEIHDSGQTLLTLVSTLLDLSKLKAGKMVYEYQDNNIVLLAGSVVKEYSALCMEKGISIKFQHQDDSILCEIDGEKIQQVIRNLLSNAIKFSQVDSSVELLIKQIDDHVNVDVIDFGVGVPENEVETIFNPFTQSSLTQTSAGGTGLGLSICKEIIESGHKGWIKAVSKQGQGTRFTFSLPVKVISSESLQKTNS